ncbi:hypothetical protein SCHPADRAFT_118402 [Schizopora paradoxa]|uniref:Uncharacterized protein n=1 Tax=Schizopora paradoxa TaxID=27342 RepID=A0A0H2S9U3_9AGAM|nr:hypothetical protein SCHPADRAFT_118402 [Schizopora paradoxa]
MELDLRTKPIGAWSKGKRTLLHVSTLRSSFGILPSHLHGPFSSISLSISILIRHRSLEREKLVHLRTMYLVDGWTFVQRMLMHLSRSSDHLSTYLSTSIDRSVFRRQAECPYSRKVARGVITSVLLLDTPSLFFFAGAQQLSVLHRMPRYSRETFTSFRRCDISCPVFRHLCHRLVSSRRLSSRDKNLGFATCVLGSFFSKKKNWSTSVTGGLFVGIKELLSCDLMGSRQF